MLTTFIQLAAIYTIAAVAAGSSPLADSSLSVSADLPVISLSPRDAGQNFIRLPALEYTLKISGRCGNNLTPNALAINVADTRMRVSGDDIANTQATLVKMNIPENQIAPIAIDRFCVKPKQKGEPAEFATDENEPRLLIRAVMSAQISFLCVNEDTAEQSMTYASQALDIAIDCEPGSPDKGINTE